MSWARAAGNAPSSMTRSLNRSVMRDTRVERVLVHVRRVNSRLRERAGMTPDDVPCARL
jgi:hypothetical protein